MTQAQLVTDLTNDVVMVAFAASVLFIVTYTVLARWWESEIGRSLITLDAGLTLLLGPSVLHRLFGLGLVESLPFAWYYLASLALVAGGTLWRTWIVAKVQWQARKNGSEATGADAVAPRTTLKR